MCIYSDAIGQIMQGPTAEPVGRLRTRHHLPISFQLSASFILLRSRRLPSGIHPVAVLHSQASWKAQIIHPLKFSLSRLTSRMLRVQTADDVAHHVSSTSFHTDPTERGIHQKSIHSIKSFCGPFFLLLLFFKTVTEKHTNTSLKSPLFGV